MKITVNDIKGKVEALDKQCKNHNEAIQADIFEQYGEVEEITNILKDLENCEKGHYSFDEHQSLIYCIKVPNHIADLPYINDYLIQDYGFIPQHEGGHNELFIAQSCGQPITIDYSASRMTGSYFIYDHEEGKPVMKRKPDMEDCNPV
jgi:hypothetical protein